MGESKASIRYLGLTRLFSMSYICWLCEACEKFVMSQWGDQWLICLLKSRIGYAIICLEMGDMNGTNERYSLLTCTIDINERIHINWISVGPLQHQRSGKPLPVRRGLNFLDHGDLPRAPHNKLPLDNVIEPKAGGELVFEGVRDAKVVEDGKILLCNYGRKNSSWVSMHGSVVRVLLDVGIVRVLAPPYFVRSRTGGRICVRSDGLELSVLTILGVYLGIADPSWITSNCWREDLTQVISRSIKPIAGTAAYTKQYYARTVERRRVLARRVQAERRSDAQATPFDSILNLIGGGGRRTRESTIVHPHKRATDPETTD